MLKSRAQKNEGAQAMTQGMNLGSSEFSLKVGVQPANRQREIFRISAPVIDITQLARASAMPPVIRTEKDVNHVPQIMSEVQVPSAVLSQAMGDDQGPMALMRGLGARSNVMERSEEIEPVVRAAPRLVIRDPGGRQSRKSSGLDDSLRDLDRAVLKPRYGCRPQWLVWHFPIVSRSES